MNASSDSSCQEFHMDTDKDTHDSLSHCTKPLIEMSSDTGTSELVLDTMKLPSQEVKLVASNQALPLCTHLICVWRGRAWFEMMKIMYDKPCMHNLIL